MDYIKPIKEQLDSNMKTICEVFTTIHLPNSHTPRYYNFREYDRDTKTLTIGSTQHGALSFNIDCSDTEIDRVMCDDFWQQFKEYRTKYLQKNFKTIETF